MRLLFCCLWLCTVLPSMLVAQQENFPSIKMQPYPEKGIYRFSSFTDAVLVLRNGLSSSQKLNFNISLNEMHFISEKGDTLSIAEPETLRYISMQGSKFYYDKGYYQVTDSIGELLLGFTQLLSIQQHRVSAYGMTEPHEGVRTYSFYSTHGKTDAIGKDEKITVTTREIYFFGDKYGHFSKASKAFVFDHFRQQQTALKDFVNSHHTNFHSRADLIKLMEFCKTLE